MAYESEEGIIVDVDGVDNELRAIDSDLETSIDDVDMAYDAAEELDEINDALEEMKKDTPPAYAVKMVHDRLRHIHSRTGLSIHNSSLEDNSPGDVSASIAAKAKAVWKWIIEAISKVGEFFSSVWDRIISMGDRVINGSKAAKDAAKKIPTDIDKPMEGKDKTEEPPKKKNPRIVTPPEKKDRKPQEDTGETIPHPGEFEKTWRSHVKDTIANNDVVGRAMVKLSYGGKSGGIDFIPPAQSIPKTLMVANQAYQFVVDVEREMGNSPLDDLMNVGLLELTNRAAGDVQIRSGLRAEAFKRMWEKVERLEAQNLKKYTPYYAPNGASIQYIDAGGVEFFPTEVTSPNLDVVRKAVGEDWERLFFDGKAVERTIDACTKAVESAGKNATLAKKQLPVAWKKLGEWAMRTGRELYTQPHVLEYTKAVVAFSQSVLKKARMVVSLYGVVIACSSAFVTMSREISKQLR